MMTSPAIIETDRSAVGHQPLPESQVLRRDAHYQSRSVEAAVNHLVGASVMGRHACTIVISFWIAVASSSVRLARVPAPPRTPWMEVLFDLDNKVRPDALELLSQNCSFAPDPTETITMTVLMPMIMPRIVSELRSLLT